MITSDVPVILNYVIYSYSHLSDIGVVEESGKERKYFCQKDSFQEGGSSSSGGGLGKCNLENINKLIFNSEKIKETELLTGFIENSSELAKFTIPQKGNHFYCLALEMNSLSTNPLSSNIIIEVYWKSASGELPGIYSKTLSSLLFFTISYFSLSIVWSLLTFWRRREILSTQNYILSVLILSFFDYLIQYEFYKSYNENGKISNLFHYLMIFSGTAKMATSLFLLTVVSMGLGVIRPSLSKNGMKKIVILTAFYSISSLLNLMINLNPDNRKSFLSFLTIIPLSICYSLFFSKIVNSFHESKKILKEKHQIVKLAMYEKLSTALIISFIASIIMVFISIFGIIFLQTSLSWMSTHWSQVWLIFDLWPSAIYMFDILIICFLLMPQENNQRYGLQQISSFPLDDEGTAVALNDLKPSHSGKSHHLQNSGMDDEDDDGWANDNLGMVSDSDSIHVQLNAVDRDAYNKLNI